MADTINPQSSSRPVQLTKPTSKRSDQINLSYILVVPSQNRLPDMSHPQLSIWQQEYALDHDDIQATFDVEIPVIADVQDWTGWAWIRSRSVSYHRQINHHYPDSSCWSTVQHG
jgi:hypothetical protein